MSDKWQKVRLAVQANNKTTQLKFNFYSANIAFGNFIATDGSCEYDGLCDFESDTCTWTVENEAPAFSWKRGSNKNNDYLPKYDHTTQTENGNFIYTLSDDSQTFGSSVLKSIVHEESFGIHCLQFWYFKPDNTRDSINVWLNNAKNSSDRKHIWSSSMQEIDTLREWQHAQVSIGATKSYQITIQALRNKNGNESSSTAIDDIALKSGECYSMASCDFNDDLCGYSIHPGSMTLFHGTGRVNNITQMPENYTHPKDTLQKNGFYIYSDFSNITDTTPNIMSSEMLLSANQACLKFDYLIISKTNETENNPELRIVIKTNLIDSQPIPIFIRKQSTLKWKQEVLDIAGQENPFQIYFIMLGFKAGSIIAVDNIYYSSNKCTNESISNPTLIKNVSCNFEEDFCGYSDN
ncbi:Apical endosomal glycoprotein-like protein, partial [Leptotrombidium deliense]